jgi:hypothetical protein
MGEWANGRITQYAIRNTFHVSRFTFHVSRFRRYSFWVLAFSSLLFLSCRTEPGNYTAVNQYGPYVYGVWNARTAKAAKNLSRQIVQAWSKETREIQSLPIMTTARPVDLLPRDGEASQWVGSRQASTYIGKNLYQDVLGGGNAELYHAYGFVEQADVEYQTPQLGSKPLILVEIFDMGSPENAFGLYSFNRYPQDAFEWVGNQTLISGKKFSFWKGKYFIQVEGYEIAPQIKEGMIELAIATAKHIKDPPVKPHQLALLPLRDLIPNSEKYFSSDVAFRKLYSRFLPVAGEVLKLGENTPGVSAAYLHRSSTDWMDTMIAFVIRYPVEANAKTVYESYRSYLQANAIRVNTTQTGLVAREREVKK